MTVWRRVVCWISEAARAQAHARPCIPTPTCTQSLNCARTHTHTQICIAYCFSTARIILWTCLSVTLHVHCLPCLVLFRDWRFRELWTSQITMFKLIGTLNHSQTILYLDVPAHARTRTHTQSVYGTSLASVQTRTCLILPHTLPPYQQNTYKVYPHFV
jgi:hypothetical protein